ncbi:MAG: SDR family oxidoreductase [Chitinophagaceae bacterium]|nr:SDR family oxidoreductase [Chitinophagaceae bacterium]
MNNDVQRILTLQSKDIWVFGGAGYLGRAIVQLLNAAGANVLCVDLDDRAHSFTDTLQSKRVTPVTLNITDTIATREFIKRQIEERGAPHGLVILTTVATDKKLEEITAEDFDHVNHGALTSVFLLAREVGTAMANEGRGSIVLFSSMYGMVSPDPNAYREPMNKNPVEYGMGKAGIIQMTRYLAVHWAKQNVRCNCVSPGPFPNPSVQKLHPEFIERLAAKTPMGRIGVSHEISGAVAFLLSDASTYVTGHNLVVDGGWTIW